MSFEEELRTAMPDLDLPERNNLLQNAAKCCVKIFKTACLQNARIGRQAFHDSAYYCDGTGKQMLLYAVPDDVFEQAMERQKLMSQYPPVVILRMSEAKPFIYNDPVDGSSTKNGLIVYFEDGSRIVYRLSGTGSSGATLRVYLERYETKSFDEDVEKYLEPLADVSRQIGEITERTGKTKADLLT